MKIKHLLVIPAIALLGLAPLSACSTAEESGSTASSQVLTLTTIMPMTGPGSIYGKAVVKMLELTINDTNEAGGVVIGGTPYPLALKVLDDQLDPETAQTVSRQALEDGAEIVIGPFGSGTASAVQPVMARGGAMWLLPIATVAGPTKNPNVFRTAALVDAFIDPEVEFLGSNQQIESVALLTDQTHTAHFGTIERLSGDLKSAGKRVVASELYSSGDTDFRAPLTQIIAERPEAIIVRGYTAESVLILQQLQELGSDSMVILNSGMTTAETQKLVADQSVLEEVYQSMPLTSLDPFVAAGNDLAKDLLERLGGESGAADAYVHDAMQILVTALQRSASPSAEHVIAAMSALKASDLQGKTLNSYSAQGDGLLFQDREVSLSGAVVEWKPGMGWTPVKS